MVRTTDYLLNLDEFQATETTMKPGGQCIKLQVYRWTRRGGSWVVHKVIKLDGLYTTEAAMREVELLAAAQHRCVVTFHGIIQDPSAPGYMTFVYSLAPGGDLSGAIGKLSPEQQYMIARDIVEGLAHLHSLRILHLDLQPANILLDGAWKAAQLADFGAARLDANGETIMTRQPRTTIYAAPELAFGAISIAADSWSLGMVLFELVVCKPMNPPPNRQFALRKPIDLSAIKNAALRQLLSRCFLPAADRVTIEEIRAQLTPAMFGASVVQPIGVIAQPAAGPVIAKSEAAQPPVKASSQPIAESPAASAVPIPAAPVGCNVDFLINWEQAHRGDAAAQSWIGRRFWEGMSGVEQDWSAAAMWYRKSAEGGNTDGMRQLGDCCRLGRGVKKDLSAAASWYRKSAEGGNRDGMYALSYCYENGYGVKKDAASADSWYKKSGRESR